MSAGVPERYRGVWARTLLQTPTARDDTTFVRWLQTARWHADLRVPADAQALSLQQGFCGETTVEACDGSEICTWHRHVDLQPPRPTPDAGRIDFKGSDRLVETGVHADYLEVWQRVPDSAGRFVKLESDGARFLVAGSWAMRVRPRLRGWPADTTAAHTLDDVLRRHPDDAAALLDFEISFGRLAQGHWAIEQSTLPALRRTRHALTIHRLSAGAAVVRSSAGAVPWRVVEWEAGASDIV